METSQQLKRATTGAVKEVVQGRFDRAATRMDRSTGDFRDAAAGHIESMAAQIRDIGQQFERHEEAHSIARRLERTADYIRFRPTADVAVDAWDAARKHHLLWWAGGLLAGSVAVHLARRNRKQIA